MLRSLAWLTLSLPSQLHDPGTGRTSVDRSAPPNVLLIIADDLGTDLLQCYEEYYPGTPTSPAPPPTPAIDWLADGGLVFTDCWTSPVCTPTRAQILTGRMPQRTGVGRVVFPETPGPGLQHSEKTLPQFLRKNTPSYFSAAVGKWHLATTNAFVDWAHPLGPDTDPWFDLWAGSLFNLWTGEGSDYNSWEKTFATPIDPPMDEYRSPGRFPGRVLVETGTSTAPSPGEYATVDTIDDAVHLVGVLPEPWFIQVSFNAPHFPLTTPLAPLGVSSCSGFTTDPTCAHRGSLTDEQVRCMVQWMDNELGRLLCDVELEGISARTVILFLGDNGTVGDRVESGTVIPGAIVAPFDRDHGKGSLYQGGVNVPLIARGPGIPAGVSHDLVSSTDLLATVMDLAGAANPDELAEDSVSFAPTLFGSTDPVRKTVFVEQFLPNFVPIAGGPPASFEPTEHKRAIRNSRYKLIRREFRNAGGGLVVQEELYDLQRPQPGGPQADPFEQDDLRNRVTPGGSSSLDRAYRALLSEMQAKYPSLYR